METCLSILFLFPFVAAALLLAVPFLAPLITAVTAVFLIAGSVAAYTMGDTLFVLSMPEFYKLFFMADMILLLYFAFVGYKNASPRIVFLSFAQIALLLLLESYSSVSGNDLQVDRLSLFMFLLVNVVGSLILLYALRYMYDETPNPLLRARFLAILTAFLGVMNLLVCADNLEWLFLFFEMTTLASFWLIGFRQNDESRENSLTALWMNQIGGLALLVATLISKSAFHTLYLSDLLSRHGEAVMVFAAFFSIAALVKGAQMPFSGWLLGAMVAPTPVSAILHSSTMVKIAPYLLLKIAPILSGSAVSLGIATIGALSFAVSAALALREENFKKILAYSTISLLGLMILTAAMATPLSILASMLLIMFHGIAKAVLFMSAGALEKQYHIKSIEACDGLINKAPLLTSLIVLGFLSISLPPFGVFFAKWLVYEGSAAEGKMWIIPLLLLIAVGSVALTLLYFKTIGRFVVSDTEKNVDEDYSYLYSPVALSLVLLTLAIFISPILGTFFKTNAAYVASVAIPLSGDWHGITLPFGRLELWQILSAFALLGLTPFIAARITLRGVDRVKPYACGEKIETNAYSFYFDPLDKIEFSLKIVSVLLYLLIIIAGVLQ